MLGVTQDFTQDLLKHISAVFVFSLHWLLYMSETAAETLLHVIMFSVRGDFKIAVCRRRGVGYRLCLAGLHRVTALGLYHWSNISSRPSLDSAGMLGLPFPWKARCSMWLCACTEPLQLLPLTSEWAWFARGSRPGDHGVTASVAQSQGGNQSPCKTFSLVFDGMS